MEWRKKENIDNILEWAPNIHSWKFLLEYWPNSLVPGKNVKLRTRDGYQVIIEKLTAISPHILKAVSLEDLKIFHIYNQELASLERKKFVNEEKGTSSYAAAIYIQDLVDLTMTHLSRQNFHMMNVFTDIDTLNYPETVRKVFIVNAPGAWSFGWKVAKNFLDPTTIEKVAILDSDCGPVLRKIIRKKLLPKVYGGELDYSIKGGGSFQDIKNMIPQLEAHEVTTELSVTIKVEKGSPIVWQFRLKHDIGFGVFYQSSNDSKKETLKQIKKEVSDNQLLQGMLVAEKPGQYILTWDNTGNWIKRKMQCLIFVNGQPMKEQDFESIVKK